MSIVALDIRVSEKFLDIFRFCAAGKQIKSSFLSVVIGIATYGVCKVITPFSPVRHNHWHSKREFDLKKQNLRFCASHTFRRFQK